MTKEKQIMINLATQPLRVEVEVADFKALGVSIAHHSQIFSRTFLATLEVVLQGELVTEETI